MQADGLDWGEVIVLVAVKGWRRSSKVRWSRWSSAIPTGLRPTMLPIARNAYYRRIFDVRRGAEGQGPASSEPAFATFDNGLDKRLDQQNSKC
jgi:hypothetical protein